MVRLVSPLVLASASPRRRQLLQSVGVEPEILAVDADESRLVGEDAAAYAHRVATAKLDAALARLTGRHDAPFVLAGDTAVVVDGDVLGKPADDDEALAILGRLAGRGHRVMTAIALGRVGVGRLSHDLVATEVRFRRATPDELLRYVATGEGRDKAGSYAIQGVGGGFVEGIVGSYSNVVGLPIAETLALLRTTGALVEWP